jgi:FkbM family methyltransferase
LKAKGILKPEFLFRPRNILARLRYADPRRLPREMTVQLHDGPFRIRPSELISRHILHYGLYDLLVTETLMRLAAPGEVAVDVGANIGYTARVLASAVGRDGRVLAFEPHPLVYPDLKDNTEGTCVEAIQAAVSNAAGTAELHVPSLFADNRGLSSLEPVDSSVDCVPVDCVVLDDVLKEIAQVGVLKIDIEGHELHALQGAENALRDKRIRDLVFEEHSPENSPVVEYLAGMGYHLFRLEKRFRGPGIVAPGRPVAQNAWEPPAFLATTAPERARSRMEAPGWTALAR